jgi:hypothetical protein
MTLSSSLIQGNADISLIYHIIHYPWMHNNPINMIRISTKIFMDALYVCTSTNIFLQTKSINISYACLDMIGSNLVCVCIYPYRTSKLKHMVTTIMVGPKTV